MINYNCFITCNCLQLGRTALDCAKEYNSDDCIKLLEEAMVCTFVILCNFHYLSLH